MLIGDGTYVQLQDTDEIKEEFSLQENGKDTQGYPKALMVEVVERGSGQLFSYDMSNRDVSELEVFHKLIDQLPVGSVVLLDDLYNCYEIFAKCIRNKIDVIVPSKRKRIRKIIYESIININDIMIRTAMIFKFEYRTRINDLRFKKMHTSKIVNRCSLFVNQINSLS